jgi:hypothetical protein
VRVLLGGDGQQESIRVETGWERRLTAESVGAAVLEAAEGAAAERMAAWGPVLDGRLVQPLDAAPGAGREGKVAAAGEEPQTAALPGGSPVARPLDVLAEEMMSALGDPGGLAAASPLVATGTGSSAAGRVTVTVSRAGLVGCAVDTRWVAGLGGPAVTAALQEALAAAQSDLARVLSDAVNPAARLDRLFTEALSVLAEPLRRTRS